MEYMVGYERDFEIKGMGKYAEIEAELSYLSSDELNELYLNGGLDELYDEFDRTGRVSINRKEVM